MINEKMIKLGSSRSKIRDLFEYGKVLAEKIGKENVFDFTLGNPSVPCPKEVDECAANLILNDKSVHAYTSAQGDKRTRAAIKTYNEKKYGFSLDDELIYMTCGAAAALRITLGALISVPSDEVIVFAPFFPEYKVFIEGAGGKMTMIKADVAKFGLNLEGLKTALNKNVRAVIINSPNNPSGTVYSEEDIKALSAILAEAEKSYGAPIYLITDEPYREILFDGATCPFVPKYYDDTVVCYSYSKALSLPGERIGYVAVSPKSAQKDVLYYAVCGAGRSLGYVCAPSLYQHVLRFCCDKVSDPTPYKDNRDELIRVLTSLNFKCVNPKGAFYLFVKSPIPSATKFSDIAKTYGLLIVPTETFGVDGYLRLATCVSKETVINSEKAFTKLAKDLKMV